MILLDIVTSAQHEKLWHDLDQVKSEQLGNIMKYYVVILISPLFTAILDE